MLGLAEVTSLCTSIHACTDDARMGVKFPVANFGVIKVSPNSNHVFGKYVPCNICPLKCGTREYNQICVVPSFLLKNYC